MRLVGNLTKLAACLILFPFMFLLFALAEPTGWVFDRLWRIFSGEKNY